jgi:hypothetical protein
VVRCCHREGSGLALAREADQIASPLRTWLRSAPICSPTSTYTAPRKLPGPLDARHGAPLRGCHAQATSQPHVTATTLCSSWPGRREGAGNAKAREQA